MAANNRQHFARQERILISSAIPCATLTLSSLPRRSNSTNPSTRIESLDTNHFACTFNKNTPLYQYDVAIEEIGSRSGEWFEIKGRARCALIMQSLLSTNRFDPQIIVWYDEQKCLYSTSCLPSPQIIISEDGRNRLNIKSLAHQWSTNDIYEYINGRAERFPYDAVRILETLLKKSLQGRVESINNTCYFLDVPPKNLPGGFQERFGFVQALNLASGQMTLNVQTKLTTFYPEVSLLEFIGLQIGTNRVPTENDYKKLNQILKDCLIVTQQSNWKQAYEIDRFDNRRPEEIKIESGKNLIDYYKNAKNIKLTHINYPCIQVYIPNEYNKPCHLPLEVCRLKAWQIYDKPVSFFQVYYYLILFYSSLKHKKQKNIFLNLMNVTIRLKILFVNVIIIHQQINFVVKLVFKLMKKC